MLKRLLAKRTGFARIFGSSILSQALLSATNLAAGLLLVRRASEDQYGYYVLINSAVPLLAQLQSSFITPVLPNRITVATEPDRKDFVGALLREQRLLLAIIAAISLVLCGFGWVAKLIRSEAALIFCLAVVAAVAWLFREFFRMITIAYRRPDTVLRADAAFAVVLVGGVWLATMTRMPSAVAAISIAAAACTGGWLLSRNLWNREPWSVPGSPGALMAVIRLGVWSATGTGIHWLFSQGYTFIVAARLDVSAVAAIAATRLLLSPLGMFSFGIATMMYSTSTLWLKNHGPQGLLRRVLLFALGMGLLTIAYIATVWLIRDWIFLHIIKKDFQQRDLLLGIWSLMFLFTVLRDQLIFLLIARAQWKLLAGLTSVCAVLGLSTSFLMVQRLGAAGGLLGLLVGEAAHVLGVIFLALLDFRKDRMAARAAGESQ